MSVAGAPRDEKPQAVDRLGSPIPDGLRPTLVQLEAHLADEPAESLSANVLALASTWALGEAELDLDRYYGEAKYFRDITPEHDRVLVSFPDAIASYLVYRMMMTETDEMEREIAGRRLERVKAGIARRAEQLDPEFPLIAAGFRRLIEENAGGAPPDDALWWALARRIGDRGLPDWQLRAAG